MLHYMLQSLIKMLFTFAASDAIFLQLVATVVATVGHTNAATLAPIMTCICLTECLLQLG